MLGISCAMCIAYVFDCNESVEEEKNEMELEKVNKFVKKAKLVKNVNEPIFFIY